jgi:hypothetical protein
MFGDPEGKRLLGRLRHRWKNYIEMACKELRRQGVGWVQLAFDRDGSGGAVMNTVINLRVP